MKRRAPSEQVAPLRRRHVAQLGHLPRKCARWARDNAERLRGADVQSPEGLSDRAADNWEPLLAIADAVGAAWPTTTRTTAVALSNPSAGDEGDSRGQLLLADVRSLLGTDDRVTTKQLLSALNRLEDRPWADSAGGKGLSPHQLSRMLARFDVRPKTIRFGTTTAKGFLREDFDDAFARYLPEAGTSVTTAPEPLILHDPDPSQGLVVTDSPTCALRGNPAAVTDVTDPAAECASDSTDSNVDPRRRRHLDS
jgi:hypothetical protein